MKSFIAVVVVIIGGAIIANTALAAKPKHKPWEPSPKDEDWWMERHQQYLNRTSTSGKDVKIVFIGSSSIEYWGTTGKELWDSKYAPLGAYNYGIRGDRTEQVLWRIEQGELDGLDPKLVVVYIGSNNVPRNKEEDIVKGVDTVITKLHEKLPNAKLLFNAFFPRGDRTPVKKTLKKIKSVTATLKPVLEGDAERKVSFLDLFSSFAQSDLNDVLTEYYSSDLLHLNKEGYERWDNLMNSTFYSLIS